MDYYKFWNMLLEEISVAPKNGERRILTFNDPRQYAGAFSQWKALKAKQPELRQVQVSPLIRAFFVPAAAGKLMNRFTDLLNVEDDLQIQIHSIANEKAELQRSHGGESDSCSSGMV